MPIKKICFIGSDIIAASTSTAIASKCPEIDVTVMDDSVDTVMKWNLATIPIHEPGLEEAIKKFRNKNLFFTTSAKGPIRESEVIFVCCNGILPADVAREENRTNTTLFIENAARFIADCAESEKIVVLRSIAHVNMADALKTIIKANQKPNVKITVLSNPPFIFEGTVMEDILTPQRIVIGSDNTEEGKDAVGVIISLYENWVPREKIVTTDIQSAELSRVMTSALIAQKISSINSFLELCETTKADIREIVKIIGTDSRIGSSFMDPFRGFSGSVFHRDVAHLVDLCKSLDLPEVAEYWQHVIDINLYQRNRLTQKIIKCFFNSVVNKKIVIFGALYSKHMASILDSPTFYISSTLLDECSQLTICDSPEIMHRIRENFKSLCASKAENPIGKVSFASDPYEAVDRAHGIVVCSDLDMFKNLDYKKVHESMMKPACIFDTRQILKPQKLKEIGFNIHTIGKTA